MRACSLCKKRYDSGTGNLFRMPRDPIKREKWSKICGKNFSASNLICVDHFLPTSIIRTGNKVLLMPNAEPLAKQPKPKTYSIDNNNLLINGSHSNQSCRTYDAPAAPIEVFSSPLNMTAASTSFTWAQHATGVNASAEIRKEQETQTDTELSKLQYFEKVRALESEKKDLQLKLSQAQTAVGAMRQIFTEGQIRKLMSPGGILWRKEDIMNALSLHTAGPRAYDYLYKKGFPLPHVSTLQRWAPKNKANEEASSSSKDSSCGTTDSISEERFLEADNKVKEVIPKEMDYGQSMENTTKCSDPTETLPVTVKEEILDNEDVSTNTRCSEPIVVKEDISPYVKDEPMFDEQDETNVGDVGIHKDNVLEDISSYVVEKVEFGEFECNASSVSWMGELSKRSLETCSDGFIEENNPEELERSKSSLSSSNNPLKQTSDSFPGELEAKNCTT